MTQTIITGIVSILSGIAWIVGKKLGWDDEITGTIGWVFWLSFAF